MGQGSTAECQWAHRARVGSGKASSLGGSFEEACLNASRAGSVGCMFWPYVLSPAYAGVPHMVRPAVLRLVTGAALAITLLPHGAAAQRGGPDWGDSIKYKYSGSPRLAQLKAEASQRIDQKAKMIQVMVDQVFSYGELGMQEVETSKLPLGILEESGFTVDARRRRHSDRLRRALGIGQAGHLARLRHRRHPAGGTEAGRRLQGSDHRGRAGPRRGTQFRHAAQHRRRAGGEGHHAARAHPRHARALAGCGRGADGGQGVPRARRRVQGRGRHAVHARRQFARGLVGTVAARTRSSRRSSSSRDRALTLPARRGAGAAHSTR